MNINQKYWRSMGAFFQSKIGNVVPKYLKLQSASLVTLGYVWSTHSFGGVLSHSCLRGAGVSAMMVLVS